MKSIAEWIEILCNVHAVSGDERFLIPVFRKALPPDLIVECDPMGNAYIKPKHLQADKPTVLLEAHSDEVGFVVQSINLNGTLNCAPIGAISEAIIPGSSVVIRNSRGRDVLGTFTAPSPHFAKTAEKSASSALPVADIGAVSAEEVNRVFGIEIGAYAAPYFPYRYCMDTGVMHGKAFDDRLGCAIMAYLLSENADNRKVNVIGLLAAQEEVGSRGASVAMKRVKADIAICLEGCPADDIIGSAYPPQTILGNGPMVRLMDRSMLGNRAAVEWAKRAAQKQGIPLQLAVRTSGGTDASVIYNEYGIPCVVVGIPVRQAHAFHSIARYQDVVMTMRLTSSMIDSIDEILADPMIRGGVI